MKKFLIKVYAYFLKFLRNEPIWATIAEKDLEAVAPILEEIVEIASDEKVTPSELAVIITSIEDGIKLATYIIEDFDSDHTLSDAISSIQKGFLDISGLNCVKNHPQFEKIENKIYDALGILGSILAVILRRKK